MSEGGSGEQMQGPMDPVGAELHPSPLLVEESVNVDPNAPEVPCLLRPYPRDPPPRHLRHRQMRP